MRTATILACLLVMGCGKPEKSAEKAAGNAPVKVGAATPVVAAAPVAAAPVAAKTAAAAGSAASPADGAEPGAVPACGGQGHDKDAPGCPGMPAAAAVVGDPAKAPAATGGVAAAPGVVGKVYGKGVSDVPVVQVSALMKDVEKFVGKRVRVEGVVKDVCPMRGCWFNMAGDTPGSELRFKVRDGVMVFPMSAKGQYAVAEGVVRKIPLNLAQSKRYMAHQAEEKGEKFDPTTVTTPMTIVRLDGVGAVLRDKK